MFCKLARYSPALATLASLVFAPAERLDAQVGSDISVAHEVFVNSEIETYLRALQILGRSHEVLVPWSIRGFGQREVDLLLPRDSLHPWAGRYDFLEAGRAVAAIHIVRPRVEGTYNSSMPYGANDGPAWSGRGFSSQAAGGFAAYVGPISLTVAPVAFNATNDGFALQSNGQTGDPAFRDPRRPLSIDLPQRFGDEAYARVDPGNSTLRLDIPILAAGVSTADQHWGPAREYPLLLGNNAGGFPHAFIGTSAPVNVWIGRLHARLLGGRLDQSDFSPVESGEDRRFASGLIMTFSPRGVDGLELGFGRFYHIPWPEGGPGAAEIFRPFERILKVGIPEADDRPENQIAGIFARWVLPSSGFEVYGEFVREDHAWDLRHLLLEMNDLSGYAVGFAKAWSMEGGRTMALLRGEAMNTENTRRGRLFNGGGQIIPLYTHSKVGQGHTQRGQLLIPAAAYGGGGAVVGADYLHNDGRWTVEWRREQRSSRIVEDPELPSVDAFHALTVEGLRFIGPVEITGSITGIYHLNHNYEQNGLGFSFSLEATTGLGF
ncbi:MAG: hypothetical protein GEU90_21245 [Gemmatimonas sp.]|nr:hypothetical protein [Gemmatimonas sp.]